jgi:hypothetical protein
MTSTTAYQNFVLICFLGPTCRIPQQPTDNTSAVFKAKKTTELWQAVIVVKTTHIPLTTTPNSMEQSVS